MIHPHDTFFLWLVHQAIRPASLRIAWFACLMLFLPASSHAASQTVTLVTGWNLISTNLQDARTLDVIFNNVATKLNTYTASGGWKGYDLTTKTGPLTVMPANQGVWVKASAPGEVTFNGSLATVTYNTLVTGMNLIAPGGQTTPQGLATAISDIVKPNSVSQIYVYHPSNASWMFYDVQSKKGVLTSLQEGQGVWVKIDAPSIVSRFAPVIKTGQTTSYTVGDDGDLKVGVPWPSPRFKDNGDGTVTDHLTSLVWMKNANCFGQQTWANAFVKVAGLNLSKETCTGYTNGTYTDWRVPNVRELSSLIDRSNIGPPLPTNHPFVGFVGAQSVYYWSSTTYAHYTSNAWIVFLSSGSVYYNDKTSTSNVWPVRGGQ
ncbi:MAG: DUF1566 domain-containing protein [Magnetococcus sp. YQC-5]